MKNVIFINLTDASFIRLDEAILKEQYRVATFKFKHRRGWKVLLEIIRQFFFMLQNIWKADLIYIWFADFHAVIPSVFARLFGKKLVIVIGGYDAAFDKELHYGAKTRIIGKYSVKTVTSLADLLLPVSNHTLNELLTNYKMNLREKSTVIYNAFNSQFRCNEPVIKENKVATVCLTNNKKTLFVKGVDFYVQVAARLPEITFQVIGVGGEAKKYLETIRSENVVLIEKVSPDKLKEILCKTKVICQFSRHEAFGVALLEGISCSCFPVGYDHAATKELLANDNGILIKAMDINEAADAIRIALLKEKKEVDFIKSFITDKFSSENRKEQIKNVLMPICSI
jgi:glycosyltransferase involved in cell wall biosynthesis